MKKSKKNIGIILLIILIILIIIGISAFILTRKPKITYEYYINNVKSKIAGNNITEYQCNNDTTLNINKDDNTYTIDNITKNSLCKIYYEDTAGEQLANSIIDNKENMYSDTNDNIYYYGETPNNYVYFNCENSDNSTCELWQIVSITKVSDVTKNNRYNLKIVKTTPLVATTNNEEITTFAWNNNMETNYLESSLYDILNNAYYNSISNYSYIDKDNKKIDLNFSKSGLKNNETRNLIIDATWRLNANTDNNQTVSTWDSDTKTGNMLNSKIALISINDYLLSLKDNCQDIKINEFATCNSKSYLSHDNGFFVLDSYQEKAGYVYRIAGNNAINAIYPTANYNIYPSLYLKDDVKIVGGDGTISNPYRLG